MPLSRTRDYLSIGEVLDAVRPDYPDVSISKIRFLEAEGLIEPERTPSGYRKFYDDDVQRLRHILALQKDHFLPLKVIKERLERGEDGPPPVAAVPSAPPDKSKNKGKAKASHLKAVPSGVVMSRDELRKATGLSDAALSGLGDFGIVDLTKINFDEYDLAIASASARLLGYGIEPRHLKMFRQFADREVSFFEQIVSPVARRRDPTGRDEATETVGALAGLALQIHEAMLRSRVAGL